MRNNYLKFKAIVVFFSLRFDIAKSMSGMHHDDFHKLAAKYKFTLAMENAVCDDYITEKLWRPLRLGSLPIVFGSPKVKVMRERERERERESYTSISHNSLFPYKNLIF